jgi:hypothetical protein
MTNKIFLFFALSADFKAAPYQIKQNETEGGGHRLLPPSMIDHSAFNNSAVVMRW